MFESICIVSSVVDGSTIIFWKRRSRAPSFSIDLRYSSSVVAPMHCITPLASAGFSMLAASIEPLAPPAPIMVCISSINIIMSGFASSSFIRFLMRSSNCPLYLVPATMPAMSSPTSRLLCSIGDTFLSAIICASPSTIALLPTPGSPISIGLFFLRRHSISCSRCISFSLPTTGSSLPSSAALVRSIEKRFIVGVLVLCLLPSAFSCWVAVS